MSLPTNVFNTLNKLLTVFYDLGTIVEVNIGGVDVIDMTNNMYPAIDILNNPHVTILPDGFKVIPAAVVDTFPQALYMRCTHYLICLMRAKVKNSFSDSLV